MKRVLILLFAILSINVYAQDVVYLRTGTYGNYWGRTGGEDALNRTFGAGNWRRENFETVNVNALFSSANKFIFMDGSNRGTCEMVAFVNQNRSLYESWVFQGGALFMNAAPNECYNDLTNLGFGGIRLASGGSSIGNVADASHPIFEGPNLPAVAQYRGSSFSHTYVINGGTTLISDQNNRAILTEKKHGQGIVLTGGITLAFVGNTASWSPQQTQANLFDNILNYMYEGAASDTEVPNVVAQNITVQLDANGNASVAAIQINNGSSDNSGGTLTYALSQTSFNCSNLGANPVTLTVTDEANNSATGTAIVTIEDNIPPTLITKSTGINIPTAAGITIDASYVVDDFYDFNYAKDNCSAVTYTLSRSFFNYSDIPNSPFTIQVTSTDASGNSTTKEAQVSVSDITSPVVTAKDVTVELDASGNATILSENLESTLFEEQFTADNVGIVSTLINWDVTGSVDVGDYISGNGSIEIDLAGNNNAILTSKNSFVLVPGDYKISFDHLENSNPSGGNSVRVQVGTTFDQTFNSPSSAVSEEVTFTVSANESAQVVLTQLGTDDAAGSFIGDFKLSRILSPAYSIFDSATDAAGIASMSVNQVDFSCADVGQKTVQLSVTDINGNVGTANATVTVVDNIPPVLTTQNANVQLDQNGFGSIQLTDILLSSTDACGIVSQVASQLEFSCQDIGAKQVSIVVTDVNGNIKTETVVVTVLDVLPITATDDVITLNDCAPITFSVADLLGNDSDPYNQTLKIDFVSQPSSGAIVDNNNGTFTYTPGSNASHTATAEYIVKRDDGTILFSENGHFYEFVSSLGITWTQAKAAAEQRTYNGQAGYLVTITSANENAFAVDKLAGQAWIGASDNETERIWKWVSGPEAGTAFFDQNTGQPIGGAYTNWENNEPNDFSTGEDRAHFRNNGQWNDFPNDAGNQILGYIVEYGGSAGDCDIDAAATATISFNLNDTENPQITSPADINTNATSAAGAVVNYTPPVGTDNCSATTALTAGLAAGATFPIGTTVVTYTATDASGNAASASFNVTVTGIAPVITQADITVSNDAGVCSAVVSYTATETTVGIPTATITYSIAPGSSFNVGTMAVTATATNAVGTSVSTFNVTVEDNEIPIALTQDLTIQLDANGNATITPGQIDNGSLDNCEIASISLDRTTFDCNDLAARNEATIVSDNTWSQSTVELVTPAQYVSVVSQLPNASTYTLGASNAWPYGTVNFFSPAIPGALPIYANGGTKFYRNDFVLTGRPQSLRIRARVDNIMEIFVNGVSIGVEDDIDGANFSNTVYHDVFIDDNGVQNGYNGGMQFDAVTSQSILDLLQAGSNEIVFAIANTNGADQGGFMVRMDAVADGVPVQLSVTDAAGNTSTGQAFVVVQDTIDPEITAPSNISVNATSAAGAVVNYTPPVGTDNCSATTALTAGLAAGATFPIGTTVVTYTATDASGNAASASFNVTVTGIAPAITVPENITVSNDPGVCGAVIDFTATETTAIPASTITYDIQPGSSFGVGTTTVTATATNAIGTSTNTFTVTVNDTEVPVITINGDATVQHDAFTAYADAGASTTDNCSATLATTDNIDVNVPGTYTVTYTATDDSNNVTVATRTVIVRDVTKPIARAKDITVYLDSNGSASISPEDVNDGTSDNSGSFELSLDQSTFDCADVGAEQSAEYAIKLDGKNDYIDMGNFDGALVNASQMSAQVWMKPNRVGGVQSYFETNVLGQYISIESQRENELSFWVTGGAIITNNDALKAGEWMNVTVVFDGTLPTNQRLKLYINGELQSTLAFYGTPPSLTGNLKDFYLGSQYGTEQHADVTYDEVRVWDKALTDQEIAENWDQTIVGSENGLIAYYSFEDGPGSGTVTELTGIQGVANLTNMDPNTVWVTGADGLSQGGTGVEVTLTATDASGNSSEATALVTVLDNIDPEITAPADIDVFATSAAGATVNYTAPVGTDNCSVTTALTAGFADGATFPIGTTVVTYTATDASGNTASASFSVNVTGLPPVIVVPADITVSTDAGVCEAVVNYAATETTAIPASVITYDIAPGSSFALGTTMVTATATNAVGSSSATFNVTVVDNEAPVVITQPLTVQLDANGNGSITAAQVNNGSSDACGIASLSLDNTTFDCTNVGVNTVTLTVTDNNGNVSTETATITVEDNIAPIAITQALTVQLDADGNGSITAAQVNNGSSDACGIASIAIDNTTFDCTNVGANTVTLTVTDNNGNVSSAEATITVQDIIAPTVIAQDVVVQLDANGVGVLRPQEVDNGSFDNCEIASMTLTRTDFSCENAGESEAGVVTAKLTVDNQFWAYLSTSPTDQGTLIGSNTSWPTVTTYTGNLTPGQTYYLHVKAEDVGGPEMFIGDFTVSGSFQFVNGQQTMSTNAANWTLSESGFGINSQTPRDLGLTNSSPIWGTTPGISSNARYIWKQDWNTAGSEVVYFTTPITFTGNVNETTLTVTDVNGNSSSQTVNVKVEDNIAPIAISQPLTVQLDANGNGSITAEAVNNGSNDACGIASLSLDNTTFDCTNVGANTVTLTVTDNNGNQSTATATITVQDNIAPIAITQPLTVQLDANGNGSITAEAVNNGSNDACGIASIALDNTTFDCSNVGANTVTLTVTDVNGNVSSETATITVEDNIAPIAITQALTVQLDANGNGSITAAAVDNGSNDACGIASLSLDKTSFDCTNVGANTVTLTVTDNNGNQSTATATITVEDNIAAEVITTDITVELDANGSATITTDMIDNGSNDACGIASLALDITSFDCTNTGANIVTLTVTDNNGNVSSAEATVTVIDVIAPTVFTQDITVALDENGAYTITASDIDAGSFDNCTFDLTIDNNAFDCTTLGANTVNLTATDASGNITTVAATVTVIDNAAPTIVANNIEVFLDENGNTSIVVADVDGGTYDNCAVASVTIDIDSFDCTNLGENIVTLTATDVNGNVSSGPAVVTVIDNIAPTVGVQSISVDLDENGFASIIPEDVLLYSEADVLRDTECDLRSSTLKYVMKLKGDKYSKGPSYGKSKKDDKKDDKKSKKDDDDDDDDKKKKDDDDDDNDDDDDDDDKDSKYAQYVFDGTGGKLLKRLDGSLSVSGVLVNQNDPSDRYDLAIELIGAYDYATWSSMDRKAKEVKYETYHLGWTYYTISSGSLTGSGINTGTTVDLKDYSYKEGFQLGNWANGDNGDEGLRGKFKGISDDDFKGELKLDVSNCELLPVPAGTVYTSDNCSIVDFSFDQDSFTCNDLNETTVMLTATDQSGNATTVPVSVTVNDRIAPVAIAQNITVSLGSNGTVTVDPATLGYESTDNTDCALTFSLDRTTFDCDDIGKGSYYYEDHDCDDDRHKNKKGNGHKYGDDDDDNDPGNGKAYGHKKGAKKKGHRVTLTVTDAAGNSSTATAYINVIDDEAPVISSAPITVVVDGKKKAYLSKYDVEAAVTDNCKVKDVDFKRVKYERSDAGMNSVAVTATDYSGNSSTGTVMVNVVDLSSYGKYVDMCYEGNSIRVKKNKVQNYLRKGASLGSCQYTARAGSTGKTVEVMTDEVFFAPELTLSSYPNPTSGYTVISFSSQMDGAARVSILSTNGVEMDKLFDDELVAQQEVEIGYEAGKLPSGIYIIRMVTAGEVKTVKLVVRK